MFILKCNFVKNHKDKFALLPVCGLVALGAKCINYNNQSKEKEQKIEDLKKEINDLKNKKIEDLEIIKKLEKDKEQKIAYLEKTNSQNEKIEDLKKEINDLENEKIAYLEKKINDLENEKIKDFAIMKKLEKDEEKKNQDIQLKDKQIQDLVKKGKENFSELRYLIYKIKKNFEILKYVKDLEERKKFFMDTLNMLIGESGCLKDFENSEKRPIIEALFEKAFNNSFTLDTKIIISEIGNYLKQTAETYNINIINLTSDFHFTEKQKNAFAKMPLNWKYTQKSDMFYLVDCLVN